MMGENCPNCGILMNASTSRLVRDACGHSKCRMCLLFEEQGCKACQDEHRIQMIGSFDYPGPMTQVSNDLNSPKIYSSMITEETILQPLELVINKAHESISTDHGTDLTRLSVTRQESSNSGSSVCPDDEFQWFESQHEQEREKMGMNGLSSVSTSSPMESTMIDSSPMESNMIDSSPMEQDTMDSLQCHVSPDTESGHCEKFDHSLNQNLSAKKSTKEFDTPTVHRTNIPLIEPLELVSNIRSQLERKTDQLESNDCQIKSEAIVTTAQCDNKVDIKEQSTKGKIQNSKTTNLSPGKSHIIVIPGSPEKYKCTVCGKIFEDKTAPCHHDPRAIGMKRYQCTTCDRNFVKQSHFEYHERMHRGYKPFECSLCGKAFPQRNKLNRHMYSHKEEKRFKCSICGKGYSKRDVLKSHLITHSGVTPYSCEVCKKSFREAANLNRHMHTHSNERPYMCELCGKNFKEKSFLVRHKRTHGKDRPFSCSECTRVFLSKSELSRHLTVHSDEKPFTCAFCNTVFRRKDNLNRHIRHHHSEDPEGKKLEDKRKNSEKNPKPVKSNQKNKPKQKQKPKGKPRTSSITVPKSPAKISVLYMNSHDQINSRIDSTGHITPVIRATGELSNAVPVINGPISIKRHEENGTTPKKTFTYTEPIPLAEAVVINRRIEEKLYPKTIPSHDCYFRDYCNRVDRQLPGHKMLPLRPNAHNKITLTNRVSIPEKPMFETLISPQRSNVTNKNDTTLSISTNETIIPENQIGETHGNTTPKEAVEIKGANTPRHTVPKKRAIEEMKANSIDSGRNVFLMTTPNETMMGHGGFKAEGANCVPTITKTMHIVHSNDTSDSNIHTTVRNNSESTKDRVPNIKIVEDIKIVKKLSDIHWRRRTSEILKPRVD